MLNSSINYPYPLLRSTPVDYLSSVFDADIIVSPKSDGYEISVHYKLNAIHVEKLINSGAASYGLEIQCTSTWYRDLKLSNNADDKIFIPSTLIHQRVDICPCIVSCADISEFLSEDFSEEYQGIQISINRGEVLAIGNRKKFDALYKEDIIKKSESIIHFSVSPNDTIESVEYDYDVIQIHLPPRQWELYDNIGQYEPWKIPMLNAIYATPIITEAITIICHDEEMGIDGPMSNYAWYKTLKYMIGKLANNDLTKYRKLLKNTISTAQMLLNDNASSSISLLNRCDKRQEV